MQLILKQKLREENIFIHSVELVQFTTKYLVIAGVLAIIVLVRTKLYRVDKICQALTFLIKGHNIYH